MPHSPAACPRDTLTCGAATSAVGGRSLAQPLALRPVCLALCPRSVSALRCMCVWRESAGVAAVPNPKRASPESHTRSYAAQRDAPQCQVREVTATKIPCDHPMLPSTCECAESVPACYPPPPPPPPPPPRPPPFEPEKTAVHRAPAPPLSFATPATRRRKSRFGVQVLQVTR